MRLFPFPRVLILHTADPQTILGPVMIRRSGREKNGILDGLEGEREKGMREKGEREGRERQTGRVGEREKGRKGREKAGRDRREREKGGRKAGREGHTSPRV